MAARARKICAICVTAEGAMLIGFQDRVARAAFDAAIAQVHGDAVGVEGLQLPPIIDGLVGALALACAVALEGSTELEAYECANKLAAQIGSRTIELLRHPQVMREMLARHGVVARQPN